MELVAVFAAEPVAGSHVGAAFVVFPDFVEARLARLTAQDLLFEDVAFLIAFQLNKAGLLGPVVTI